jgi:hypothetical protein
MPRGVIKLSDRRPERPDPNKVNDAYKNLVMKVFDDFEHKRNREIKDRRAEVERNARQKL